MPELNRSLDFRRVASPAPEIAKSPGEGASHSLRLVAKDYYVKTYGEIQLSLCRGERHSFRAFIITNADARRMVLEAWFKISEILFSRFNAGFLAEKT